LQPYPDDLVGPLQSSFVPGHGTTNNALIAQEVIHHMTRSKNKRGTTITWIIWFSLHLHTTTTHRIRMFWILHGLWLILSFISVKPSFAGDVNFDGKYVFFGRFLCEFSSSKSSHWGVSVNFLSFKLVFHKLLQEKQEFSFTPKLRQWLNNGEI